MIDRIAWALLTVIVFFFSVGHALAMIDADKRKGQK